MTSATPSQPDGWEFVADAERRPELIRRLREELPEAWSTALYRAIVLDLAASADQLTPALTVAASVARHLVPQHQAQIFERCIALLRHPADPYDRNATRVTNGARHAAAELLAANPALDELAIGALIDGSTPALLPAVASGVRAGVDPGASRFLRYTEALGLAREQLVRFAEDCSSDRSPVPIDTPPSRRVSRWRKLWMLIRTPTVGLLALAFGPALAGALALLGSCIDGRLTTVSADAGVAVGLLAVLAAVHVLSVQLAATSLPSRIAVAAAASTPILFAYGLAVATLAVALLTKVNDPPLAWHPGAVAAALLVSTTCVVVYVTVTSLRQLGAAPVTVRAARAGAAVALRAASVVRDLEDQQRQVTAAVEAKDYLRRPLGPDETSERRPMHAPSPGVLEIDHTKLKALGERRPWRDGDLRLDLFRTPGADVGAEREIAAVVPSSNVVIEEAEFSAATSAFKIVDPRRLRSLDTLCVAVVDQLLGLVRSGDSTGARTVQAELLKLLDVHMAAVGGNETRGAPPQAVLAVLNRTMKTLALGRDDAESNHCVELIESLVQGATKNDNMIGVVAFRSVGDTDPSLNQLSALYSCGQRAIQLRADSQLLLVQHTLKRLMPGSETPARHASETAARLVQYAAIVDPESSRRVWARYVDACRTTPESDQVQNICRIGAVALRVQNLSLAVEAAFALPRTAELDTLHTTLREPENARRENVLSEIGGQLLGTDAETRLVSFVEAAQVFRRSLAADEH